MEFGLREWLIVGAIVLILLIIFDGWRRMRGGRSKLKMAIDESLTDMPNDGYNPELPNGGARVRDEDELNVDFQMPVEPITAEPAASSSLKPQAVEPEVLHDQQQSVVKEPVAKVSQSTAGAAASERIEPTFQVSAEQSELTSPELEPFEDPFDELGPVRVKPSESGVSAISTAADRPAATSSQPLKPVEDSSNVVEPYISAEYEAAEYQASTEMHQQDVKISEDPVAVTESVQSEYHEPVHEVLDDGLLSLEPELPKKQTADKVVPAVTIDIEVAPPPLVPDAETLGVTLVAESEVDNAPDQFGAESEVIATSSMDELVTEELPELAQAGDVDYESIAKPVEPVEPVEPTPARRAKVYNDMQDADPLFDEIPTDEVLDLGKPVPVLMQQVSRLDEPAIQQAEMDLGMPAPEESAVHKPAPIDSKPVKPKRKTVTDEPQAKPVIQGLFADPADHYTDPADQPQHVEEHILDLDDLEPISDMAVPAEPESLGVEPEQEVGVESVAASFADDPEPVIEEATEDDVDEELAIDPANMLMIMVASKDKAGFAGGSLAQILEACGMSHGKMQLFHRYEDGLGKGASQFSVANNSTESGQFDRANMDQCHTRGVTFFMSLSEPKDVMTAFECMLATAETLARHLGGELLDEDQSVMRSQTQEHYRQRIRDFEMQNLRRRAQ